MIRGMGAFWCAVLGLASAALIAPRTARGDALQESIFALGVHIGNAHGVSFGLANSYDTRKEAHPAGEPLVSTKAGYAITQGRGLNLDVTGVEDFRRNLPTLSYRTMMRQSLGLANALRTDAARTYQGQAGAIMDLAIQITWARGIYELAANCRPNDQGAWLGRGNAMLANIRGIITGNQLAASVSTADGLIEAAFAGARPNQMRTLCERAINRWLRDFRDAQSPNAQPRAWRRGRLLAGPVRVPANTPTPTPLGITLKQNEAYFIHCEGTVSLWSKTSDAGCDGVYRYKSGIISGGGSLVVWEQCKLVDPTVFLAEAIKKQTGKYPAYNPEHVYEGVVFGTGKQVKAVVHDGGGYSDNGGAFQVSVYEAIPVY